MINIGDKVTLNGISRTNACNLFKCDVDSIYRVADIIDNAIGVIPISSSEIFPFWVKTAQLNIIESKPMYSCPNCGSHDVAVFEETLFMVNSGEFYCHSVKSHDSNAKVSCLNCDWLGQRHELGGND